jgi:glutamine synthetase
VVSIFIENAFNQVDNLEEALAKHDAQKIFVEMANLRETIDELEALVPSNIWPLPSYAEILLLNA